MAGFEVIIYGRFWVIAEAPKAFCCRCNFSLNLPPVSRLLLMTQARRTIGLVPRLRRSIIFGIGFPALPGWADVWRSALRALPPWRFLPCHFSLNLAQAS